MSNIYTNRSELRTNEQIGSEIAMRKGEQTSPTSNTRFMTQIIFLISLSLYLSLSSVSAAVGGRPGRVHLPGGRGRLRPRRLQPIGRLQHSGVLWPHPRGAELGQHVPGVGGRLQPGPVWVQRAGEDPPVVLLLPGQPLPQRGHLSGQ